jgi:hypothetical protein
LRGNEFSRANGKLYIAIFGMDWHKSSCEHTHKLLILQGSARKNVKFSMGQAFEGTDAFVIVLCETLHWGDATETGPVHM